VLAAFFARSAKKWGIWFDSEGQSAPFFGLQASRTAGIARIIWPFLEAQLSTRCLVSSKIKPNTPFFGRTGKNRCK
jgi:hypothetical protein